MVQPAEAENGKKLQQSGSPAEPHYTHGGVKKTKFEPKVPTRRLKKLSAKSESPQTPAETPDVIPTSLQRLLQQTDSSDGHRSKERTSKVAFGFGGFPAPNKATAPVGTKASTHSVVSRSRVVEKQEFLQAVEEKLERKNVEVFDHEKYFPVTLPLRKPIAGVDTRRLDEEEFGEEVEDDEGNEDGAEAAEELGLMEPKDEDTLFFFQLPKGLPISLGKEKNKAPSRSARLEDFVKGGAMGKLLVYESGAVKFKVGEVVFDALPGTECTFAQEVAAVNITSKQCSFVGEVHQRVVLTPDIVDVLPDLTDWRTKR